MNKNPIIKSALIAITLTLTVVSCNSSSDSDPVVPKDPITKIYIANSATSSIKIYDSADTVNGDVAPDREVVGAATNIDNPYGIAYDSRTDTIFSGNWTGNNIVIYDAVSSTTGNIAPSRELVGAATGITKAHGVFVDEVNNLLYVSGSHGVAIYANANTLDGNVAPARLISGAATQISGVSELRSFVDTTNDRLYVSDPQVLKILVFDNVSTLDGDVAPDRVITGAATTFAYNWGMTVDVSRDLLYVGDTIDNSVMVFTNASTADGNIAPTRKLKGVTSTIDGVSNLFIDPATNTLFVADNDSHQILIWQNASSVDGDIAPDRVIGGAATGISNPGSVVGVR